MRNMREQITSIGERLTDEIGNVAVKIGEQSRGFCAFAFIYEAKTPLELLQENIEE